MCSTIIPGSKPWKQKNGYKVVIKTVNKEFETPFAHYYLKTNLIGKTNSYPIHYFQTLKDTEKYISQIFHNQPYNNKKIPLILKVTGYNVFPAEIDFNFIGEGIKDLVADEVIITDFVGEYRFKRDSKTLYEKV